MILARAGMAAAVIHAIQVPVAKHGVVVTDVPLPRRVVNDGHLLRRRMMKAAFRAVQFLHQEIIHKQLAPVADVDRSGMNLED